MNWEECDKINCIHFIYKRTICNKKCVGYVSSQIEEDKKYTIEEIKKAFWDNFHECGELWFGYLGTNEENDSITNVEWESFLFSLTGEFRNERI